jgi:hypothetical protein
MKKMYEESNIQDIADAIREKNGTEDTYKPSEMADAIRGIGGTNPLEYATGVSYKGSVFPDDFDLVVDIPNFTGESVSGFFYGAKGMRSIKMTCNNKEVVWEGTNLFYATTQPTTLKTVDFTEFNTKIRSAINLFLNQTSIVSILGAWDMSECTNFLNIVFNCHAVKEIRFVKETIKYNIAFAQSSLLIDESIQSIIDGLADLTGQTTQTITFHSSVVTKLTEEQNAQVLLKNWVIG